MTISLFIHTAITVYACRVCEVAEQRLLAKGSCNATAEQHKASSLQYSFAVAEANQRDREEVDRNEATTPGAVAPISADCSRSLSVKRY